MQAKCLAQRLARQSSGTEAAVLTDGCGLVLAAERTSPQRGGPAHRARPETSSQGLLSSLSQQILKPQMTKPQVPAAFPALPTQGGKRARKQADIHQERAPFKGDFGLCPQGDPKPSYFPRHMDS